MLKTRIITAIAIFAVVLPTLLVFPPWAWAVLTMAIGLVGCWEWSMLCQMPSRVKLVFLALSGLIAALVFSVYVYAEPPVFTKLATAAFVVASAFWLIAMPFWLAKNWRPRSQLLLVLVGWIVVFPTWFALVLLREPTSWLLLTFAAIVWIADIAAYFAGKALGRHKLAPSISPGKTIEGALGGVAGVAVYFFIWQALTGPTTVAGASWAAPLHAQGLSLLAVFILLACISVLGDLFESWMKRGAGMKDSSALLPGHGGILDRIDALTATLPLAGMYFVMMPYL